MWNFYSNHCSSCMLFHVHIIKYATYGVGLLQFLWRMSNPKTIECLRISSSCTVLIYVHRGCHIDMVNLICSLLGYGSNLCGNLVLSFEVVSGFSEPVLFWNVCIILQSSGPDFFHILFHDWYEHTGLQGKAPKTPRVMWSTIVGDKKIQILRTQIGMQLSPFQSYEKKQRPNREASILTLYIALYFRWLCISTTYPDLRSAMVVALANDCNWCFLKQTGNHKVWISDDVFVHLSSLSVWYLHPWICFQQDTATLTTETPDKTTKSLILLFIIILFDYTCSQIVKTAIIILLQNCCYASMFHHQTGMSLW